jgi:hypothetical protein
MRFALVVSLAVLAVLPAACGGGNLGGIGSAPATGTSPNSAKTYSTAVKLVTEQNKPIAGVTVTLSKNRVKGPVIASGYTGTNGSVTLSGFKLNENVCAWAMIAAKNGRSQKAVAFCAEPFPSKARLIL